MFSVTTTTAAEKFPTKTRMKFFIFFYLKILSSETVFSHLGLRIISRIFHRLFRNEQPSGLIMSSAVIKFRHCGNLLRFTANWRTEKGKWRSLDRGLPWDFFFSKTVATTRRQVFGLLYTKTHSPVGYWSRIVFVFYFNFMLIAFKS